MDFTREPIIESIVTPREGFKLVVRSSKGVAQDEYFIDSVEIVSFGNVLFFRSRERPKCFMVPVSDYEILEVREARMVLKNVGADRSTIKIGGGRAPKEKDSRSKSDREETVAPKTPADGKPEKKRERRRHSRRRRGRDDREVAKEEGDTSTDSVDKPKAPPHERVELPAPSGKDANQDAEKVVTAILPPPSRLISQTIDRYREDEQFKGVFQELPPTDVASDSDIQAELKAPGKDEKASAPRSRRPRTPRADAPQLIEAPSKLAVPPPPPPIEESAAAPVNEPATEKAPESVPEPAKAAPEAENHPAGEEVH